MRRAELTFDIVKRFTHNLGGHHHARDNPDDLFGGWLLSSAVYGDRVVRDARVQKRLVEQMEHRPTSMSCQIPIHYCRIGGVDDDLVVEVVVVDEDVGLAGHLLQRVHCSGRLFCKRERIGLCRVLKLVSGSESIAMSDGLDSSVESVDHAGQ